MILASQYLERQRGNEPQRRLMAAVLQAVVDDCRERPVGHRDARQAADYLLSGDRGWPYSFENVCEALGMDASGLRAKLLCGRHGRAHASMGHCPRCGDGVHDTRAAS